MYHPGLLMNLSLPWLYPTRTLLRFFQLSHEGMLALPGLFRFSHEGMLALPGLFRFSHEGMLALSGLFQLSHEGMLALPRLFRFGHEGMLALPGSSSSVTRECLRFPSISCWRGCVYSVCCESTSDTRNVNFMGLFPGSPHKRNNGGSLLEESIYLYFLLFTECSAKGRIHRQKSPAIIIIQKICSARIQKHRGKPPSLSQ